ncbi:phospho-sugar mutase [Actinotalea sp. AC32]|nr:phospho-sugar mutase [Actinotalea sp. AC32]
MTTSANAAPLPDDLVQAVRSWVDDDPDATTSAHLARLLEIAQDEDGADAELRDAARAELADRFRGTLEFGTAGLRGALGGGPNRMNRAVVIRAAAGLVRYLVERLGELHDEGVSTVEGPRVVIGYDARHNSDVFARDTAAVVTAAGGHALLLPEPLPTPVLAFAVRHLGADAGVMVTASHNPPQDNGYKVYLGGRVVTDSGQGAQIVPPYDEGIAAHIAAVPSVRSVHRSEGGWTVLGEEVLEAYLTSLAALRRDVPTDLRVVLTPLHGVGGHTAERVLRGAGFEDLHIVPEQALPDPEFPTVAFPNPEEPGAIDLALALAEVVRADLVVANDPDADRCALAVRDARHAHASSTSGPPTAAASGWRMLHGDEVGALLGQDIARRSTATGGVLASSIVSSRLLARIAADHGMSHRSTLTGFKWISRVEGLVFGYEEALGYCVDPAHVRDKDGLSAALLLVQLAAELHAQGRTLVDELDDLARRHGLHLTDQLSARFADLDQIPATMARVRTDPPRELAGSRVVEVTDLSTGADGLPPTDGLRLVAEDGTRVIVRPSGTEPKVKCYLEVIVPVPADDDGPDPVGAARRTARERLDAVRADVAAALGLA